MENRDKYQSLLVIVVGFMVLYFIFQNTYDWYFFQFKGIYFLYFALAVGVLSLLFDSIGELILMGWYKLAEVLGWINTRIILSIIFYVFLTPFAFLQKIFSNPDLLELKNKEGSVFHERNHSYKSEDFENVW